MRFGPSDSIRPVNGCPVPGEDVGRALSERLLDFWPVWELQERVLRDGISIQRVVTSRPGWVKIEIDWHDAESAWEHAVTASTVLMIVAATAKDVELYLNHFQVKRPPGDLWEKTLDEVAREATMFFRTERKFERSVGELICATTMEKAKRQIIPLDSKVNTNILANSFKMMEKRGDCDWD